MMNIELQPQIIRMPPFIDSDWLNTVPINKPELFGQVVLIDFWEYSCINCLRTLPYLREWHHRYHDKGLTIIGIHTAEFKFGQVLTQVRQAIDELAIPYPILLDKDFQMWHQYTTKAWPTKYLIDAQGYIRYIRRGEGHYQEIEAVIQRLLRLRDDSILLPDIMPALRPEDETGAVCYPATSELHAGYLGGLFGGALGNEQGYVPDTPTVYMVPPRDEWELGRFYAGGFWQSYNQHMSFAGKSEGYIYLPYEALGVHAVLSPTGDDATLRLNLVEQPSIVEVKQDKRWLTKENAGQDIQFDENGHSYIQVDRPRLYDLVRNDMFGFHDLELIFRTKDTALYTFTFTSCVME